MTTWTYSQRPSTSNRDAVRFLVGDTDPADKRVSDSEIEWALSAEANVYYAAAYVCRALAAKSAELASKRIGDLSVNYSERQANYLRLAYEYETRGKFNSMTMFAGGISEASKDANEANTDLVKPAFKRGVHDDEGAETIDELRSDL